MSVIKQMDLLFSQEGLTPKQYVTIARIKAARIQRAKDYALTKAEVAAVSEIERDQTKWQKRMETFGPQKAFIEPEPKKEEPAVITGEPEPKPKKVLKGK